MDSAHGYNAYTKGCRCDVCRAAKAAYMRAARSQARARRIEIEATGVRYVAEGITHGIRGYRHHSCRCQVCARAATADRARTRRSAERRPR